MMEHTEPPTNGRPERDVLRVSSSWLVCFVLCNPGIARDKRTQTMLETSKMSKNLTPSLEAFRSVDSTVSLHVVDASYLILCVMLNIRSNRRHTRARSIKPVPRERQTGARGVTFRSIRRPTTSTRVPSATLLRSPRLAFRRFDHLPIFRMEPTRGKRKNYHKWFSPPSPSHPTLILFPPKPLQRL